MTRENKRNPQPVAQRNDPDGLQRSLTDSDIQEASFQLLDEWDRENKLNSPCPGTDFKASGVYDP
jgi:hypothetical protein